MQEILSAASDFCPACLGNAPFHLFGGEMGMLSLVTSPTKKCRVSNKQYFTGYHNAL